ncbi:hypothetical protein ATL17_0177 [Maritalea mobilis]|uniref:Uncharacterized protein n=1 Tax=Maritalea mobilis TaxID=483324 RepID=A0A4R6VUC2_9HYPH|nr:hypothetical protein [Maritalea mobilis]TDQ66190.1 hypothetical protein ATL17_0177 [Maritalea mobilis]
MSALDSFAQELRDAVGTIVETDYAIFQGNQNIRLQLRNGKSTPLNVTYFGREDPNNKGAKYHHSQTIQEMLLRSKKDGILQKYHRGMMVAHICSLWEDKYRAIIAKECSKEHKNEIMSDYFFDINKYRQAILHAGGRLDTKTKLLNMIEVGDKVEFTESQMFEIFEAAFDELNRLNEEYYAGQPTQYSLTNQFAG